MSTKCYVALLHNKCHIPEFYPFVQHGQTERFFPPKMFLLSTKQLLPLS